jgi:hypothetical protein
MSRFPEPVGPEPDAWQPATSLPGELYTPEGQIKATGAFVRGLRNRDPRLREYRRSMRSTALAFIGIAAVIVAMVVVLQSIF